MWNAFSLRKTNGGCRSCFIFFSQVEKWSDLTAVLGSGGSQGPVLPLGQVWENTLQLRMGCRGGKSQGQEAAGDTGAQASRPAVYDYWGLGRWLESRNWSLRKWWSQGGRRWPGFLDEDTRERLDEEEKINQQTDLGGFWAWYVFKEERTHFPLECSELVRVANL